MHASKFCKFLIDWCTVWKIFGDIIIHFFIVCVNLFINTNKLTWHRLCSFLSTAFNRSISVRFMFTYCAIIVNQSYTKDYLNSTFKARHSNFRMFDKMNDDLYKRWLMPYNFSCLKIRTWPITARKESLQVSHGLFECLILVDFCY